MDKYIRVKNCNCISDATIEIVEKSLNIKYGSNGTGKSTISEAIYAQANNETDRLKDFKPYGSNDNSQPTVDNPYFHVVKVFNEDYVNSYLFQGDEFLDDSFQVFLKSDKCDSLTKDIVMSSNASMAVKIVNLRKYVELTKPEFGTSAIYEVLSNVIHGRQNPIYKDGQEISADVLEQGMREVSQYIPNKSYTDLINGTSTEILISSMSSDDLYHRIISIRLLFERVEGTLSLLRKKYPAACKFVNETNHVENDYIYQLDPRKYFGIPNYYLQQIENFIQENKETILAGNILTENTEVDQIGDN